MMLWVALAAISASASTIKISLKASDGVALAATYYVPASTTAAIVLLPMLGGSRRDWESFAVKAASSGIAVLSLDPRGHGDSENPYGQDPGDWDKERWLEADRDPAAAVAWLESRGVAPSSIFIGGASIGASMAFRRAASDPRLGGAALISPGDNPKRVPVSESIAAYARRPLFIASAADDPAFDAIAGRLAASVAGPVERLRFAAGGHGTDILADPVSGPALAAGLLDWMAKTARKVP
jgi:dienelactone hydrolase